MGLPISRVISRAISSARSVTSSKARRRISPRSRGAVAAHSAWVLAAASIAAIPSSGEASATSQRISPVDGSSTGNVFPSAASRSRPPISSFFGTSSMIRRSRAASPMACSQLPSTAAAPSSTPVRPVRCPLAPHSMPPRRTPRRTSGSCLPSGVVFSPRTAFAPRVAVAPRPDLPTQVPDDSGTAVVVGGGIAGVSAALVLAERGVPVELLEAAPALGGRLGTWRRTLPDGTPVTVEHGYHGFFRQYYTLRAILRRLDTELGFLRDVGGYPIEGRDPAWAPEDFTDLPRVPLANLAALVWKSPSFRLRDLRKVDGREALEMLRYDPVATFAKHDHRTTAELLDAFGFSERGRAMLFEVFAHSFFN